MEYSEIKQKVTDAATTATRKAGELANKAKIRFALANLQSDLDELYEKLGKIHYEAITYETDNTQKENAVIDKINSVKSDMEILKAELESEGEKKNGFCPSCGKKTNKSSSFCPYCGKKLG